MISESFLLLKVGHQIDELRKVPEIVNAPSIALFGIVDLGGNALLKQGLIQPHRAGVLKDLQHLLPLRFGEFCGEPCDGGMVASPLD